MFLQNMIRGYGLYFSTIKNEELLLIWDQKSVLKIIIFSADILNELLSIVNTQAEVEKKFTIFYSIFLKIIQMMNIETCVNKYS